MVCWIKVENNAIVMILYRSTCYKYFKSHRRNSHFAVANLLLQFINETRDVTLYYLLIFDAYIFDSNEEPMT